MIRRCAECKQPLLEGVRINFIGTALYHDIPSKVAYAISDIEPDPMTFVHTDTEECFEDYDD